MIAWLIFAASFAAEPPLPNLARAVASVEQQEADTTPKASGEVTMKRKKILQN